MRRGTRLCLIGMFTEGSRARTCGSRFISPTRSYCERVLMIDVGGPAAVSPSRPPASGHRVSSLHSTPAVIYSSSPRAWIFHAR